MERGEVDLRTYKSIGEGFDARLVMDEVEVGRAVLRTGERFEASCVCGALASIPAGELVRVELPLMHGPRCEMTGQFWVQRILGVVNRE